MPIAAALASFKAGVTQCDSLIANAHQQDANGPHLLPEIDRRQITVAAFLNMFREWESFLEAAMAALLSGATTINGIAPAKIASPASPADARIMVKGINRYFDYGNHQLFRKIAEIYFVNGGPFQPHINAINGDLDDLRTMRHASAHMSSTTQSSLDTLALRLLGRPSIGIDLYDLLTAADPQSAAGETIYQRHRDILVATAELIANG